jgi:CRP-like cAMP-binding protein
MRSHRSEIADQLGSYETFAGCARQQLEELAAVSDQFGVPPQWSFLQQGTPGHEMFVITEGAGRVYRGRTPIAELGPGDVVGEMAFFGNGQREATVSSVSRFRGVRINYAQLGAVLRRRPQLLAVFRDVYTARRTVDGLWHDA